MKEMKAYVIADNIISPLGFTSAENFRRVSEMETGLRRTDDPRLSATPVYAGLIDNDLLEKEFAALGSAGEYTRLEKMALLSARDALSSAPAVDIKSKDTLIIFSSTKGNIDLLGDKQNKFGPERLLLSETANVIAAYFGNPNSALTVSNACISGVLAIILGQRLIEEGKYRNIVIIGADMLTRFVVSGFQSFKAVSGEICKPYDASRDGISLGEACGTIILSSQPSQDREAILVKGGASSNDANHISGPSRNGEGLNTAIRKTLKDAGVEPAQVEHISGHGTATVFNDEMESIAISDAGLAEVPMNSLKSYFGHTLGAAGVIESVIGIHSILEKKLAGTYNYSEQGVSRKINVISATRSAGISNFLKTAAGFGGCNAAVMFAKA